MTFTNLEYKIRGCCSGKLTLSMTFALDTDTPKCSPGHQYLITSCAIRQHRENY